MIERILPESLRNRFGGRMPVEHTLGRCSGLLVPFPGLPPVQCVTQVRAATGFTNRELGRYYCQSCAAKIASGS